VTRLLWTLHTPSHLLIGLAIATAVAIALTRPAGAQTTEGTSQVQSDPSATNVARCLQDWDPATHMTKQEWTRACQRLGRERGEFIHKPAN
jgi:predicted DNA-binding protein (MmcQ/YjbR family)